MKRLLHPLVAVLVLGCHGPRPSGLSADEPWLVTLKSTTIPDSFPWYSRPAHHTWLDVKRGDEESWQRIEIYNKTSGVRIEPLSSEQARADERWSHRVSLLASVAGEEAQRMAAELEEQARRGPEAGAYEAWPGPNSNTFVVELLRGTPGLRAELHHNAVGKDYEAGAHLLPSGTGLQLDLPWLGLGCGLREGVELHLLGLTLGVGLWPPALKLPLLPRLGVHPGWVR